jgi:REP element-mobilizing transposase RayT
VLRQFRWSFSMSDHPLAYFITFTTYGTWLHGQCPGSVDDEHNQVGTPFIEPNPRRRAANQRQMTQELYLLDAVRRKIVLDAIIEECRFRGWTLHALHIRSNHVHLVVTAQREPEFVMRTCKANASKRLNQAGFEDNERKRWTAHGSTRYLWNEEAVAEKCHYTLHSQGDVMEAYNGNDKSNVRA